MQRYIKEVNELETRGKTEDKWKLFKPANIATVKAILRTMQDKLSKTDLLAARKFLGTSGYDENGRGLNLGPQAYLNALELHEAKKGYIIAEIQATIPKLAEEIDKRNVGTAFARNPLASIDAQVADVGYFLNRSDQEYHRKEITKSALTDVQKEKLLKYLEGK